MAEHLASIFGTEKDRVNCLFYFKIGACRHGDRCSRLHTRPSISPTLLLANMYQRPDTITPGVDAEGHPIDPRKIQEHFEDFYEDLFEELSKYGEIESLNVCDNLADHMVGRPIIVDFSPVTDFREATCRQYEENSCDRGGYCNFMHLKMISSDLRRHLIRRYRRRHSRSRSPYRHGNHEDCPYSGLDHGRHSADRNRYHEEQVRSDRSRSPGHRRRSNRSPGGGKKNRSPVRESSAERRAKIAQWNREREQLDNGIKNNTRGSRRAQVVMHVI
ncbi:putative transcription factor C3H family [Dioscorea sansibarensis]